MCRFPLIARQKALFLSNEDLVSMTIYAFLICRVNWHNSPSLGPDKKAIALVHHVEFHLLTHQWDTAHANPLHIIQSHLPFYQGFAKPLVVRPSSQSLLVQGNAYQELGSFSMPCLLEAAQSFCGAGGSRRYLILTPVTPFQRQAWRILFSPSSQASSLGFWKIYKAENQMHPQINCPLLTTDQDGRLIGCWYQESDWARPKADINCFSSLGTILGYCSDKYVFLFWKSI